MENYTIQKNTLHIYKINKMIADYNNFDIIDCQYDYLGSFDFFDNTSYLPINDKNQRFILQNINMSYKQLCSLSPCFYDKYEQQIVTYQMLFNFLVNLLPERNVSTPDDENSKYSISIQSLLYLNNKITIGGLLFVDKFMENNELVNYLNQIQNEENSQYVHQIKQDNSLSRKSKRKELQKAISNKNTKKYSISGFQPKYLCFVNEDKYIKGKFISNYIVKCEEFGTTQYPNVLLNEFLTTTIANQLLNKRFIDLHQCDIFQNNNLLFIKRFDVETVNNENQLEVQFHYMIDGCQLLGVSRRDKYDKLDSEHLAQIISHLNHEDRLELFKQFLFNILIVNDDNHLKNISFFYHDDEIKLTPAYDLLNTGSYFDYPNNCLSYYHSDEVEQLANKNDVFFFIDSNFDYLTALAHDFQLSQSREEVTVIVQEMIEALQTYFDSVTCQDKFVLDIKNNLNKNQCVNDLKNKLSF